MIYCVLKLKNVDEMPNYTNQQIMNVFYDAARFLGYDGWALLESAGLTHIAEQRSQPYTAMPIAALPNLPEDVKTELLRLLEGTPIPALKLDVPWISQLGHDANLASPDCGQACVLMLMRYHGKVGLNVTVNQLVQQLGPDPTTAAALKQVASQHNMTLASHRVNRTSHTLHALRELIAHNKPIILLVDCGKLGYYPVNGWCSGLHWVVVVGSAAEHFYLHDPLWPSDERQGQGGAYLEINARHLLSTISPSIALTNE